MLHGQMSTLVVVPCGAKKIWSKNLAAGPTPAKNAYIGPPFVVNRAYAERFGDEWRILSAKYGFMDQACLIPANYNVTFTDPHTQPITVEALRQQVREQDLERFSTVVALGSRAYGDKVAAAFAETPAHVCSPVAGLRIGKMMGLVRHAVDTATAFTCEPATGATLRVPTVSR